MTSKLVDYNNPSSMGSRFRAKRIKPLLELIEKVHEEKGEVKVLDIGGRKSYWNIVPEGFITDNRVKISLLNLPDEIEKEDDSVFTNISGNACDCKEYADNSFDIVHSNSVIEHVGSWSNIKLFAGEVRRLAPRHFVQTPYFWFPVEPHFIKPIVHWLPRPLRVYLFTKMKMGNRKKAASIDEAIASVESEPYLLDQKTFKYLFPESKLIKERWFLFVKSLIAVKN